MRYAFLLAVGLAAGCGSGGDAPAFAELHAVKGVVMQAGRPVKGGAIDKLDKNRLHGEVVTFARCVAALDKMTVAEIMRPLVSLATSWYRKIGLREAYGSSGKVLQK